MKIHIFDVINILLQINSTSAKALNHEPKKKNPYKFKLDEIFFNLVTRLSFLALYEKSKYENIRTVLNALYQRSQLRKKKKN